MITYEKALELKRNGFKQTGRSHEWYIENTKELLINPIQITVNDAIYVPSLEELIEACGGALESLENKVDRKSMTRMWKAWGIEMEPWNPASNQMGQGSTTSEAVANLWLELNKKIVV